MPHQDTIAGGLLLALAGLFAYATRGIADSSLSDAVGPTGLPNVLAAALAILAVLLIGKGVLAGRGPAEAAVAAGDEPEERATPIRALGFVAIGIGYMIAAPLVGFAPAIALLIVAVAIYEGARPTPLLFLVAAGGGLGFWLGFVKLLGADQPVSRFFG